MKREQERKGERGQSLTEFAVGVIFILVLLAGGMDFGRAYFSYISIRDAAQEGAAYASIAPSDVTGIRSRVRDTSSEPIDLSSFIDDQIDVVVSGSACAGNTVSVTVEYDFNIVAPFIAGNTLHLEAEAIDTILQPPC
ncbi:MAG: TadE/TadG family type IV pilus assembly protein [Anaerolineales bacterium]